MDSEEIREKLGEFNEMPPNVEWITESEWLWRCGHMYNCPVDYRQVKLPDERTYHGVYLMIAADFSGVGFVRVYDGKATRATIDAFKARWFKFKYCNHEFETTLQYNCHWEGKCKKCGYESVIDSSD